MIESVMLWQSLNRYEYCRWRERAHNFRVCRVMFLSLPLPKKSKGKDVRGIFILTYPKRMKCAVEKATEKGLRKGYPHLSDLFEDWSEVFRQWYCIECEVARRLWRFDRTARFDWYGLLICLFVCVCACVFVWLHDQSWHSFTYCVLLGFTYSMSPWNEQCLKLRFVWSHKHHVENQAVLDSCLKNVLGHIWTRSLKNNLRVSMFEKSESLWILSNIS